MGITLLAVLLVVAAIAGVNTLVHGFVCPFCGGSIRRAFEKMECKECGRLFFLWQARRK